MKCPNCNNEVMRSDAVCRYCGMLQPVPPVSGNARRKDPRTETAAGRQTTLYGVRQNYYTHTLYNQEPYNSGYAVRQLRQQKKEYNKRNQIFREVLIVLLTLHVVLDFLLIILSVLS